MFLPPFPAFKNGGPVFSDRIYLLAAGIIGTAVELPFGAAAQDERLAAGFAGVFRKRGFRSGTSRFAVVIGKYGLAAGIGGAAPEP